LTAITIYLALYVEQVDFGGVQFKPWQLFLGIVLGFTFFSFRIIKEDEIGAIIVLGRPCVDVSSTIAFAPKPISVIRLESALTLQKEYPEEPHKIYYGSGAPPDGYRIPYRITTGGRADAHTPDPLDRTITIEPRFFVRIRITSMVNFVQVIGDTAEAFKQIEDSVVRVLRARFAQNTPRQILNTQDIITGELETLITNLLRGDADTRSWGVALESFGLTDIDITKTVNEAIRDVAGAGFQAQTAIEQARGTAESTRLTESAVNEMRRMFLQQEAVGFIDLMQALGITDPAHAVAVLQTEQARSLLENAGNITVIGGGSTGGVQNMFGLVQELIRGAMPAGQPPTAQTPDPQNTGAAANPDPQTQPPNPNP
jgi:regulator of protease activity HflC (stomatin/prohibitin superfamily)